MLMQLVASFMGQSLPVIAPLIMASTGLAPERVGNLSSLTALATVLYLMIGGVFLARMGPVRLLEKQGGQRGPWRHPDTTLDP